MKNQTIKEPFHIAFGVDGAYVRYMSVTLASIVENNRDVRFAFHVFSFSLSETDRKHLRALAAKHQTTIEIHIVESSDIARFSNFSSFSQYSNAIFARLFIPQKLRDITDTVLYLDSDIICAGSLHELMEVDLGESISGVVSDHGETTVKRQVAALNLRNKRYFNSGVMYINIPNWIEYDVTRKAIDIILNSGMTLAFPDQDALNIVLDGRATFIDEKWNYRYNLEVNRHGLNEADEASKQRVFMHFTGRVKPWHEWSLHDSRELFRKYQALTPWADTPLDMPKNHKEMRMFSRFLLKKGKALKSFWWYLRYLSRKLLK